MKRRIAVALSALTLLGAQAALAQGYPNRPIRMIIPQGAGGASDALARMVGQALGEALGQPVVAENRPGAGGIIGVDAVAKAAPDGYTVLFGSNTTMAANVFLYKKVPFDPVRDFVPLAMIARLDLVLLVPPSLPARTLPELVALAKSRPGQLNYGYGTSSALLCGEMFKSAAAVDIAKVAYKSSPLALNDLLSNQIQFMCESFAVSLPLAKAGKVRVLAVTSTKRSSFAPELPTAHEAGATGMEYGAWLAFFAPAGMPREIAAQISAELVKITRDPAMAERIRGLGFEPMPADGQELGAIQRAEIERIGKVIKSAGIQAE
ncbi:MAG: tripartite tricarboxylate transporter substrate binding protein [Burkholderiaceae bacterium]|nr:tripartite tricarboxylate transporter substrate binding protein [Burkholderiaceae bacterium]